MAKGRTTLIPKKDNPLDPADFRPITVGSVLTRGLHKILARRLEGRVPVSVRQKGFKPEEGVSINIAILGEMGTQEKRSPSSLYLAFVDFKKAFDSVSHPALLDALGWAGVGPGTREYLASYYGSASTEIEGRGVRVTRGVMQGDPLSPILFNMALDFALRRLPVEVKATVHDHDVRYLAFADDVVLVASSREGLQRSIDSFVASADLLGLGLGLAKCATTGIHADRRRKTWYQDTRPFAVPDGEIPTIQVGGFYKYLGTEVGVSVREMGSRTIESLRRDLASLQGAPLKPNQKLWALTTCVLPKILFQTVHGELLGYHLSRMDKDIRKFARRALHLPGDTPLGAFHTSIKEGGLGITNITTETQARKSNLLNRLVNSTDALVRAVAGVVSQRNPRYFRPTQNNNNNNINFHRDRLYQSNDGAGLRDVSLATDSHWVGSGAALLSGGQYCQAVKLRLGVLATPARAARGDARITSPACDLGCRAPGTLHHIQQVCPAVQPWRVMRHNRALRLVEEDLSRPGWVVVREPHITTSEGLRKPDLVVWEEAGTKVHVIDAQIVSDSNVYSLSRAHDMKVRKYNNEDIKNYARRISGKDLVEVGTVTLNWRGAVAAEKAKLLKSLKLSKKSKDLLEVRTIQGSLSIYANYNGMTGARATA